MPSGTPSRGPAAPGPAASPNGRLKGDYALSGSGFCVSTPRGFNNRNQPNDINKVAGSSGSYEGVVTFDGPGKFAGEQKSMGIGIGPETGPKDAPAFTSSESWIEGDYRVGPHGEVTMTYSTSTRIPSGPRAGQTIETRGDWLSGHLSADNKTLLLAHSGVAVATVGVGTGSPIARICIGTATLSKLSP
jgi:hypothetical protein